MYSNHDICNEAGLMVFNHLINYRQINFLFNIITSKSSCLYPYITYFLHDSFIMNHVRKLCQQEYKINDVVDNDQCAVKACIYFVQNRERHSSYYVDVTRALIEANNNNNN